MYNYKRGIIVLAVISLVIFTPLMAMFPLTSAQNTASSPVGTLTFSPSGGTFPGELVNFGWTPPKHPTTPRTTAGRCM